jgi:hypothetical protein
MAVIHETSSIVNINVINMNMKQVLSARALHSAASPGALGEGRGRHYRAGRFRFAGGATGVAALFQLAHRLVGLGLSCVVLWVVGLFFLLCHRFSRLSSNFSLFPAHSPCSLISKLKIKKLLKKTRTHSHDNSGSKTCSELLSVSLKDRSSEVYWLRVCLFEFAEMATLFFALRVCNASSSSSEYQTAERLIFFALAVNTLSLLPLWGLLSTLRTDSALSEAMGRAYTSPSLTGRGGVHPAVGAFASGHRHQYSPKTLLYCRATFILCDIIADFAQFVASMQLGLTQGLDSGALTNFSTFMAVLTLLSMSFSTLEMHQVSLLFLFFGVVIDMIMSYWAPLCLFYTLVSKIQMQQKIKYQVNLLYLVEK